MKAKLSMIRWGHVVQFIKFCLVGISNTAVYLGVYYLSIYLSVYYLFANVLGFILSVLNAYYWSKKYVFVSDKRSRGNVLLRTYLSYGLTTVLSTLLLYFLVDIKGVSDKVAPLLALVITIPINFLLNKFWTFK